MAKPSRELTAILFTDLVGFTEIMRQDERKAMNNNPEPILFLLNIIWLSFFIVLLRYFCRGNTWGYLFGIMGYFIIPDILEHFQTIQVPDLRYHLIAAILCIGLFFLYFLKEAFFKPQMIDE